MRPAFCTFLLLTFTLNVFAQKKVTSPLAVYSKEWKNPKYLVCNTAKNTAYLSEDEKRIIYILNLARMNPKLFCQTVVSKAYDICNADTTSAYYYKSLVTLMMTMKPLKLLKPDTLCYQSAQCHAVNTGISGYVGHDRQSDECLTKQRYSGECVHYGESDPLYIVIRLLIDHEVESLGHRKICFTNYGRMAPSTQPHKWHGHVTVLDFLK